MLCYSSPYPVDEYIAQYFPHPNARLLAMMPISQPLVVKVGGEERATAYMGL